MLFMPPARRSRKGSFPAAGWYSFAPGTALDALKMSEDEMIGVNIIRKALEEPIRQIANNAGVEGSIVVDKVMKREGAFGYNAETDNYEDMITAGVIDPTKVARTALENAASIGGLLLTTEALITEKPEEKKAMLPDAGSAAAATGICINILSVYFRNQTSALTCRGFLFGRVRGRREQLLQFPFSDGEIGVVPTPVRIIIE